MDPSLMYEAAKSGAVDVISAFSTDPRIASYGLVPLDDDKHAFPRYDAVILVSPRLQATHPEVVAALQRLDGGISETEMARLNGEVDERGRTPEEAAEEFLRETR
jgi:osmoprotectant transport system permease protein